MNRKELLKALNLVEPGLSPKESIEQSDCYVFSKDRVVTFNDDIAVSTIAHTGFEGAVHAKTLYTILSRMKEKEIELSMRDEILYINGKKGKGGMRVHEDILLPMDEIKCEKTWVPVPHGFIEALRFCLNAAATNPDMGILTGVHVSQYYTQATDNFRVARRYYQDLEMPFNDFIIPGKSILQLIKYDISEMFLSDSWVHFRVGDEIDIACRIYNEDFPNINKFFDRKFKGEVIELPDDFVEIIKRADVFSLPDDELEVYILHVSLKDGKIRIKSGDKDSKKSAGFWNEVAEVDYDKDEIGFYSSPPHLVEMFNVTREITLGKKLLRFEREGDFIFITGMLSPRT